MDDLYDRWNVAIAEHFFREEFAGKQIFLFVDEGLIADLARKHDLPDNSFLTVAGAPGPNAANVASRCLAYCDRGRWRDSPAAVYPPYLVHLALFALAAGLDEHDLPDNAYYNRLRRYLGLPDDGHLTGFDRLGDEVWKDLETWSTYDMDGSLGIFRVRIYGHQRHVGIPRSQTLLWEEELKSLPRIFATADLDPTDDPTDQVLVQAMHRHARDLRAPTRRTLLRPRDDVLRSALLDVIRGELAEWDGSVGEPNAEDHAGEVFGHLRLFLHLNPAKLAGSSTLRCTLASPYPDHTLALTNGALTYTCEELVAPWSTRLAAEDGKPVNAAAVDWVSGLRLTESTLGWRFTMRGASLRIFESAESYGLPGWVEVSRLDHGKAFLVACRDPDLDALLEWGSTSCTQSAKKNFTGLLPNGWHLLQVYGVQDDSGIRAISASVGLPSATRIRLVGGVKSGRGAKYYAFAPPEVHVSGVSENQSVSVGGHPLDTNNRGLFCLPEQLPRGEQLTIAVREGDRLIASQTLMLLDEIDWTAATTASRVDRYGESSAQPGLCGAFADAPLVDEAASFHPAVVLPPASKAVLLGRRPGEVCDWPSEPWPDWEPVWAITPPVRGRVHRPVVYCGSNTAASQPMAGEPTADRRRIRRWRVETWTRRKRNVPPANPRLRGLWNEYIKAGHR